MTANAYGDDGDDDWRPSVVVMVMVVLLLLRLVMNRVVEKAGTNE